MIGWFKTNSSLPGLLLGLAMLAYAAGFSYLTLVRYEAFESRALDMGNLDQAVWNTAHGNWFRLTNQPGTINRLSLHVEPILIPISWLYWLASGPPTLLVLQAMIVALGAWPLFALARYEVQNDWLALVFGLLWLLNPTLQAANWYEFHPLTLAPTFLVATFYCLITRRSGWFVLFAVLAASCKEEVALLIFMIGGYTFFVLRRRRLGLLTMTLSLAWALVAVLIIQNTFAAGNIHWERYAYLGDNPAQIIGALLTQPHLVLAQLRAAHALSYLALLLLPVGFSALLAPEILLLALPSIALNLLADFPPMHQVTELIYAVAIVPFVLIAAIYGVKRINTFLVSRAAPPFTHFVYPLLALWVGACALYAQWHFGYLPSGANFQLYTVTEHHRRADAIIAQISPAAKVSAQDRLDPHVSGRETVYIFPRIDDADTVLLDVTGPPWPLHPTDIRRTVDDLLAGEFGIAAADDGYLLLRKGEPNKSLPKAFFSAWQPQQLATSVLDMDAQVAGVDFTDKFRLLAYQLTTDSHGELVTQFEWQALQPIAKNVRFYVGYLADDGTVLHDTQFYPPVVELWYPTSQWTVGQRVHMQTLPWTLAASRFTLVLGLYSGDEWQQVQQRLPVTTAPLDMALLEGNTLVRLGGYVQSTAGEWLAQLTTPSPAPAQDQTARFGAVINLTGWTVEPSALRPGEELSIQLGWVADATPDFDYALFVHLLDQQGEKVAQIDGQPQDALGPRPLTTWRAGQVVVDERTFPIPAALPTGDYTLVLGLYNWQTGERLPVTGAAARPDETVRLTAVKVE